MNPEKPKTSIKKWDEVNDKLRLMSESATKKESLTAEMNEKILAVQNEYKDTIEGLNSDFTNTEKDVFAFVELHKEDFNDGKTKVFDYGEIALRKGTGTLGLKEGITEEKVILNIKKIYKKLASTFIATKESLKKQALKSLTPAELKKLGLVNTVSTSINITLKKTETKAVKAA